MYFKHKLKMKICRKKKEDQKKENMTIRHIINMGRSLPSNNFGKIGYIIYRNVMYVPASLRLRKQNEK